MHVGKTGTNIEIQYKMIASTFAKYTFSSFGETKMKGGYKMETDEKKPLHRFIIPMGLGIESSKTNVSSFLQQHHKVHLVHQTGGGGVDETKEHKLTDKIDDLFDMVHVKERTNKRHTYRNLQKPTGT